MNLNSIPQPESTSLLAELSHQQDFEKKTLAEDGAEISIKNDTLTPKQLTGEVPKVLDNSLGIIDARQEDEVNEKVNKSRRINSVKNERLHTPPIPRRPELYSSLGPWDFLIDRSNLIDEIEDGVDCKSEEYLRQKTNQRLETAIKGLEEIIIKFKKVIEETCSFNDDIGKREISDSFSNGTELMLPENVALLFPSIIQCDTQRENKVLRLSDPSKLNYIFQACTEAVDSILQFFLIKNTLGSQNSTGQPFESYLPMPTPKTNYEYQPFIEPEYDDLEEYEGGEDFEIRDASDLIIFGNETPFSGEDEDVRKELDYFGHENDITDKSYEPNINLKYMMKPEQNHQICDTLESENARHSSIEKRSSKKSKGKLKKGKGKGRPIGVNAEVPEKEYPGIPKTDHPATPEKFKYRPKGYYPDFCISKEAYDSIIENHVPNTPFVCSQCNKSFKYRKRFDNHFVPGFQRCPGQPVDHLEPTYEKLNNRLYCRYPGCTNELMSKSGVLNKKYIWKHHQKEHLANVELPFKCKQCTESFLLQKFLVEHVSVVHKQHKKKCCSICGKILFGGQKSLDAHMIVHTGEKVWKCPHCDMSFSRKETKDRHVKWQHEASTLKLHICEVCGKGCLTKPKLKDHILTHSDKGTFLCKLCGKYLKNDCSYRRHMVCVHGIKHTCDVCNRDYSSPVGLKIHRRDVHNIPF